MISAPRLTRDTNIPYLTRVKVPCVSPESPGFNDFERPCRCEFFDPTLNSSSLLDSKHPFSIIFILFKVESQ